MIGVPPRQLEGLAALSGASSTEPLPDQRSTPAPGRPSTGERIARRFFELCENPRTRERVMRTVRSSADSADSAVGGRLLVALLSRTVMTPLLRSRRVDGLATKTELVAAHLGGIAVLRYVTRMEPVASMPVDDLVVMVGPALQTTLDAPPRGVPTPAGREHENGPRHPG